MSKENKSYPLSQERKYLDFETLWASIPYPGFIIGKNNVIKNVNTAGETICLQSLKQIIGKSINWYLGQNSVVDHAIDQSKKLLSSFALYDVELTWLSSSKSIFDVIATPINYDNNNILLLFHPQGTPRKMDRNLLHRSAARSVTGMASVLAHEIRNPLAGISGAAQLIASNASTEDKEFLDIIQLEVERIGLLVKSFEAFGEIKPIINQPINIHNVLNQAVRSAKAGYASHINIIEQYDPSLPLAGGDSNLLLQVIQNLLKNAAEAVPKTQGQITINTSFKQGIRINLGNSKKGLPLQISIMDNGDGVPDQIKDDIFDPFVTSKPNGSGLGLSLVSKVISDHGGVVEYCRNQQRSVFTLLLPTWTEKTGE